MGLSAKGSNSKVCTLKSGSSKSWINSDSARILRHRSKESSWLAFRDKIVLKLILSMDSGQSNQDFQKLPASERCECLQEVDFKALMQDQPDNG